MEYDCEMFDDAEAALDALLAKAQWEPLEAQVAERLRSTLARQPRVEPERQWEPVAVLEPSAIEAPELLKAASDPVVTWASGPCEVAETGPDHAIEISEPKPVPSHRPEVHVTGMPALREDASESLRLPRRSWREPLAIAAGVLLLIGAVVVAIHVLPLPSTVHNERFAGPLPGRAPTPLELWQISPAGQKYLAKLSHDAPAAPDPRAMRVAQLCRFADSQTLWAAALHESSPDNQAKLLEAMLSRRDGVDRFLDLVLNRLTRDRALGMLANLPRPPTDLLLSQLNNPSVAYRFAAAKALGTLCHGDTLPILARMIQTGNHQREALAVLSECRDGASIQYLRQLQKEPAVAAQLSAVQSEMQQLF